MIDSTNAERVQSNSTFEDLLNYHKDFTKETNLGKLKKKQEELIQIKNKVKESLSKIETKLSRVNSK